MLPELRRAVSDAGPTVVVIVLSLLGFALIVLYAFSQVGPHLRYLSVGLLTAFAAMLAGSLAGLVVGIPRDVSSGALRVTTSKARPGADAQIASAHAADVGRSGQDTGDGGSGQDTGDGAQDTGGGPAGNASSVRSFEPSTNLAEISDWLTKLLLGAGLVGLTHLGGPLGRLVDTVARGLGPPGTAVETAAAILIGYAVLGFLAGYLATTLWYGRRLQAMFDR